LVGSNLQGPRAQSRRRLKAAFVDIGFEKNAFLHYWDIVPSNFDSGWKWSSARAAAGARNPRSHRRTFRVSTAGSDLIVQVTKGRLAQGPRVTTNLVLPGRYLVLLPNSDQKWHLAEDRNTRRSASA